MLKTKRVDMLDDHTPERKTEDENIVLFNTRRLAERDPAFASIKGESRFLPSGTDGKSA